MIEIPKEAVEAASWRRWRKPVATVEAAIEVPTVEAAKEEASNEVPMVQQSVACQCFVVCVSPCLARGTDLQHR
jgi:hypothetical protein